jgi:transposase
MDHLPLYRQHEIFERMGADIPESTLIGWVKDRSRRDQTVRGTV